MRYALLAGFALLLMHACRDRSPDELTTDERKNLFLPAITFVAAELDLIDSLPLAVLRYRTTKQGSDTGIVSKPVFRQLMQAWFGKDFAEAPLHTDYRRKVFHDATIGRVTITCDTEDPGATFRRMDILMDPETDAIRSLYVEKVSETPEGKLVQKLYWSAGRQCRISKTPDGGQPPAADEAITYAWGADQP